MDMHTQSDTHLLERWRWERDARAFRELANRHSQMVFNTCRRILRDAADAEDITQECFLRLAQHGEPLQSLPAWLHVMAVRQSLNHLRARGRRAARERDFAETQQGAGENTVTLVLGAVDEAIGELPEALRAPLVLHFLESHGQDAVAQLLGVSQPTVSRRIERAISLVRASLQHRGIQVSSMALAGALQQGAEAAVPAALAATLGKVALAGDSLIFNSTGGWAAKVGGILLMKKAAVVAAVALVVAGGFLYVSRQQPPASEVSFVDAGVDAPKPQEEAQAPPPGDEVTRVAATAGAPESAPAALPAAAVATSETAATTGVISGRVFDFLSGEGVAGVTVTAAFGRGQAGAEEEVSAESDADGNYVLTGLKGSAGTRYSLDRTAPAEYQKKGAFEHQTVTLNAQGEAVNIDFPLKKGISLAGLVVDAANRPVDQAKVWLGGGMGTYINESVITAPDGTFEFAQLPFTQGLALVAEKGEDLASEPMEITLQDGSVTDAVLQLQQVAIVSGTIVDGSDKPLPGLNVLATRVPSTRVGTSNTGNTSADAAGRFSVKLSPGRYELAAWKRGLSTGSEQKGVPVSLEPGQQLTDVKLVYGRDLTIEGQIVDSEGKPVEGADVSAGSVQAGGGTVGVSGADGRFVIADLEPGEYDLRVNAEGYQYTEQAEVPAGAKDVKVVLATPFTVVGQVQDARNGTPITAFELVLATNWEDDLDSWAMGQFKKVSHAEGRFELTQSQSYRSVLAARAPGYATAMLFLDLTGPPYQREAVLKLEPGADLTGHVTDVQGGPVADAQIFWGKVVGLGDRSSTRSGADGAFTLPNFPSQAQRIAAYHPDFAVGSLLVEPQQRAGVRLVLHRGGTVSGQVSFAEGMEPVPCAVTIVHADKHFVPSEQTEVSQDGLYELQRVPPGEAEVSLQVNVAGGWRDSSQLTRRIMVQDEGVSTLDFKIGASTGAIAGRIAYPPDAAPARVIVRLKLETPDGDFSRVAVAAPDGSFLLEDVPAGTGTLDLDANFQNHVRITKIEEIEVGENESIEMDINL